MRKIISVIMVLVLGVVLVGSSAYAVNPDPNAVRPWICQVRPDSGDDIGIDDPQLSPPTQVFQIADLVCNNWSFIGLLIYDFVIDTAIDSDDHGSNDGDDTEGSSGANPQ